MSYSPPPTVAVVGAGAVGSYLGGRLAALGPNEVRVTLFARGAHLRALQRDGLQIYSRKGDELIRAGAPGFEAASFCEFRARSLAPVPFDFAIVTVKRYDTAEALAAAVGAGVIGADTTVVSFQNGIDADKEITDELRRLAGLTEVKSEPGTASEAGRARQRAGARAAVVAGATYAPVSVAAPGVVSHAGQLDRCVLGRGGAGRGATTVLAQLLRAAGVDAATLRGEELRVALWSKLGAKAAFDAVAHGGATLGTVLAVPPLCAAFEAAAREVHAVARAAGAALPADATEALLRFVAEQQSPAARSSMAADLAAGRPVEVESLSGAVARRGAELGVPTPVHSLTAAVLAPHTKRYAALTAVGAAGMSAGTGASGVSGVGPAVAPAPAPSAAPSPAPQSMPPPMPAAAAVLASAVPRTPRSPWAHVPAAPPDPIMGLVQAFRTDEASTKVCLAQGAYRTEAGTPLVLESVRAAERAVAADTALDKEYPPIDGDAAFRELSARFVFGESCAALAGMRVATAQTLSGTGALRLAMDWLRLYGRGGVRNPMPEPEPEPGPEPEPAAAAAAAGAGEAAPTPTGTSRTGMPSTRAAEGAPEVWLPLPTWPTHHRIAAAAGLRARGYRYLRDAHSTGALRARGVELDFDALVQDLTGGGGGGGGGGAPARGTAVLLQACAHNPSGVDPTPAQWDALAELFAARGLVPLFDCAYQGYATADPERDAHSVRAFVRAGLHPIVCQSYAKSMGLYGERVGAINFVCASRDEASAVLSVVKRELVRPNYSCPPLHGARIASRLLRDPALRAQWLAELGDMVARMRRVRECLAAALASAAVPGWTDWGHILRQNGMFALTGLGAAHVEALRERHHIYMTKDGRLSVAGLRLAEIPAVANAIVDVLRSVDTEGA
eukprot:g4451.t1